MVAAMNYEPMGEDEDAEDIPGDLFLLPTGESGI
jgi:hypothetical protein